METMKETIFLCSILFHSAFAIVNTNVNNLKGNVTRNSYNYTQEILRNRNDQILTSSPSSNQIGTSSSRNPYRHFFSGGGRPISYLPHKSPVGVVQANVSKKAPSTSYSTSSSATTASLNLSSISTLQENRPSIKGSSNESQRNRTQQFSKGDNSPLNDHVVTSTDKDIRIQESITTEAAVLRETLSMAYITPVAYSTTPSFASTPTEKPSTFQSTIPNTQQTTGVTHRLAFTGEDLINLGYPTLYNFFTNKTFHVDLASLGQIFAQNMTGQGISANNPAWDAIAKNGTLREEFYSLIDRIYRNITNQNSDGNGHKNDHRDKNFNLFFGVETRTVASRPESSTPPLLDEEPRPQLGDSRWNQIKINYPAMAGLYLNRTFEQDLENLVPVLSSSKIKISPLIDALRGNETIREEMISYYTELGQEFVQEKGYPPHFFRDFLLSRIEVKSTTTLENWLTSWPVSSTTMKSLDEYSNPKDFWIDNPGKTLDYMNMKVPVVREPNTSYSRIDVHSFSFHKNDFLKLGYPVLHSVLVNGTIRVDVKNEFTGTPESHKGWLNIFEMIQNNDTLGDEFLSLMNRINEYLTNPNATNDPPIYSYATSNEEAPAPITPSNSSNFCAFEQFTLEKFTLVTADDPQIIFRHFTDDLMREMRNGLVTIFRQILRGEVSTPYGNFREFLLNGGSSHLHVADENSDGNHKSFSSSSANINEYDPISSENYNPAEDSDHDINRIRAANKILAQKLYGYLAASGTNLRFSTRIYCAFNAVLREYDFRNHNYYFTTTDGHNRERYIEVQKRFVKILTGKEPSNLNDFGDQTSFIARIFEAALADAVY